MKGKLLLLSLFAMAEFCLAQTSIIPFDCPEPEFAGDAYIVTSAGEVMPVPHEQIIIRGQASFSMYLTGLGNAKGKYKMADPEAPLQVFSNDFWIIVRVEDNNRSPYACVKLFKFEKEGMYRTATASKVGSFSGASSNTLSHIGFSAHKYKTSSYAIKMSLPFAHAEYGMMVNWSAQRTEPSNDVLTFGVRTSFGPREHLKYIYKNRIDLRLYDDSGRARYYDCATGKYINEARFARKYGRNFLNEITEEYYKMKKIPMKEALP